MGCNAIRTSHNPPAPGLLDLCDKHGDAGDGQAFDMWRKKKPFDYHLEFNEWSKTDLETQIKRDRKTILRWSSGAWAMKFMSSGGKMVKQEAKRYWTRCMKPLQTWIKQDPPLPPIIYTDARNRLLKPGVAELVGYNYHHNEWGDSVLKKWNDKPFIITESVRPCKQGHYDMPSDSIRRWPVRWDKPLTEGNPDTTCSAYENCSAPLQGSTMKKHWKYLKAINISRVCSSGRALIILENPRHTTGRQCSKLFWYYGPGWFSERLLLPVKSTWTSEPVLHVFPHWNEQAGPHGWKKGDSVDIWGIITMPTKVELFVNGKSMGAKQKRMTTCTLCGGCNMNPVP